VERVHQRGALPCAVVSVTSPTSDAPKTSRRTARFRVDPQLATLLGEGYRSSEFALKELVDNAWDADASEVRITLPGALSGDPIIIADDGTGMTPTEVDEDYLRIARSRRSRKGEHTSQRNRAVKGRKGIGKFAGLMAADTMILETRCRGTVTRLQIRKEDLRPGSDDLETIDLPIDTAPCDPAEHGTTITLTGLHQGFDVPTADRLKPLLMLEYGRQSDFALSVNNEPVGVEDIPGESFHAEEDVEGAGRVRLSFTVSEGRRPLRQSGVAVRVTGKVIGKPSYFGLEEDEDIPPKLLRKVYGELEADGLIGDVNAAWDAIFENSTAFAAARGWAVQLLKDGISRVYANEVQLARARRQKDIQRRLAELPEHRRPFAEQQVERVVVRFYGEKEERIDAAVGVLFDALEYDPYWAVVQAVDAARMSDVSMFASALDKFGLVDMSFMADQARRRLEVLDRLDDLLLNPETREAEMHKALERNLWVLGAEHGLLASNRTLRAIIEQYTGEHFNGERATRRPDLLLASDVTERHLLIEFKRPSVWITREHESQAIQYRDDLRRRFDNIEIVLVGAGRAQGNDAGFGDPRLRVTSYAAVVSRARKELAWLVGQLDQDSTLELRAEP
jgi:hypothetical protein